MHKTRVSLPVYLYRPQITGWGVTSDGLKFWQVRCKSSLFLHGATFATESSTTRP